MCMAGGWVPDLLYLSMCRDLPQNLDASRTQAKQQLHDAFLVPADLCKRFRVRHEICTQNPIWFVFVFVFVFQGGVGQIGAFLAHSAERLFMCLYGTM